MSLKQRLRGVIGTAIVWGSAFSLLSSVLMIGQRVIGLLPSHYFAPRVFLQVMGIEFGLGAIAGALFATLIVLRERRQELSTLSTPRLAMWGFVGAATLAASASGLGLLSHVVAAAVTYGVIGAGLAVGTLRFARHAQSHELLFTSDRSRLEAGV